MGAITSTLLLLLLLLLGTSARAAEVDPLVKTVCAACHGEQGHSVSPTFPHLAGQQAEYLAKQLRDFLAGRRASPVMSAILGQIQQDDVPRLAAWYAARKPSTAPASDVALAARGRQVFEDGNTDSGLPACVGCHQAGGAGNERYPRLAGQQAAYSAEQLRQFRSGARKNDAGRVMRAVAARMTDDEIAAVSEFLAGLP